MSDGIRSTSIWNRGLNMGELLTDLQKVSERLDVIEKTLDHTLEAIDTLSQTIDNLLTWAETTEDE